MTEIFASWLDITMNVCLTRTIRLKCEFTRAWIWRRIDKSRQLSIDSCCVCKFKIIRCEHMTSLSSKRLTTKSSIMCTFAIMIAMTDLLILMSLVSSSSKNILTLINSFVFTIISLTSRMSIVDVIFWIVALDKCLSKNCRSLMMMRLSKSTQSFTRMKLSLRRVFTLTYCQLRNAYSKVSLNWFDDIMNSMIVLEDFFRFCLLSLWYESMMSIYWEIRHCFLRCLKNLFLDEKLTW